MRVVSLMMLQINNRCEKEGTGTIEENYSEMVDFKLQNEDGIECYEFKEGDNIS